VGLTSAELTGGAFSFGKDSIGKAAGNGSPELGEGFLFFPAFLVCA